MVAYQISLDNFCLKHISEIMGIKQSPPNANPSQDIWPYSVRDYQPLWSLERWSGMHWVGTRRLPMMNQRWPLPNNCDKKLCALPLGKSWRCCLVLLPSYYGKSCVMYPFWGNHFLLFQGIWNEAANPSSRMYQHDLVDDGPSPFIIELKLVRDLPFLNLGPPGFFVSKCIASWQSSQVVFAGRGTCI